MFILSDVYVLPDDVAVLVRRMVIYIVMHYGKHFLTSPLSLSTPRHDLNFIYRMKSYRTIDAEIADSALESTYR